MTFNLKEYAVLANKRGKIKESEKLDEYLDLARELKNTVKHEGNSDTNRRLIACIVYQKLRK